MGLLRKSVASKLKTITKLAVSRIAILKKQHQARLSYARSDVVELLNLGYQVHALQRVEHFIEEQNMVGTLVMIEYYCNFLRERAELLEESKECPDELKEATSNLIFASSRCGELPDLQKMREIFTTKFGKEYEVRAVELQKNNGVNPKMIQKLSLRRPDTEIRLKVLQDIATEIGVILHVEDDSTTTNGPLDNLNADQKQEELEGSKSVTEDEPNRAGLGKAYPIEISGSDSHEFMSKNNHRNWKLMSVRTRPAKTTF